MWQQFQPQSFVFVSFFCEVEMLHLQKWSKTPNLINIKPDDKWVTSKNRGFPCTKAPLPVETQPLDSTRSCWAAAAKHIIFL